MLYVSEWTVDVLVEVPAIEAAGVEFKSAVLVKEALLFIWW